MDAASWNASLPLIIIFLFGALALWFAIRIEVDKTIADLRRELREARAEVRTEIREVGGKIDAMNVRASEHELERARQRGVTLILGSQTRARKPKRAPRTTSPKPAPAAYPAIPRHASSAPTASSVAPIARMSVFSSAFPVRRAPR